MIGHDQVPAERPDVESVPRTVAVVEDDRSMRTSVERLLNAHGFATEVYPSAESFLDCSGMGKVDCLVVDIHLGGMSGIDLRYRLIDLDLVLPVIFITAIDDDDLELAASRAGCIAYLHKPFSAASLIGAINEALANS